MNTEREWDLQERALREERARAPESPTRGLRAYRAIARALRRPLEHELPPDFAARVARRAAARTKGEAGGGERVERGLFVALCGILAAVAIVVLVGNAEPLIAPVVIAAKDQAGRWLLALAGCVALSAISSAVMRTAGSDTG